jgi:hypothetical protein
VLPVLAAASLVANLLLVAGASGQATPQSTWVSAPAVPLAAGAEGKLRDVAVISATEVWVVGWTGGGGENHTLAARWDGTGWTATPTPDSRDPSAMYVLNSVDAVTTDDVWAVGGIKNLANPSNLSPLFLHYDGRIWTEKPAPDGVDGEISDVDLLTADEGWAVGTQRDRPLILRRTAAGWAPVPVPVFEVAVSLESVYATSSNDAWAVGSQKHGTGRAALMLHWDGISWSEIALPTPPGYYYSSLVSVAATSASDVWAVGTRCPLLGTCDPWVLHLAGATWRTEPTQSIFVLTSLVAFAPNDVWIFGQTVDIYEAPPLDVLDHIERWDGARFTGEIAPPITPMNHHPGSAQSLAAASGDRRTRSLWAVGWIKGTLNTTHAIYRT